MDFNGSIMIPRFGEVMLQMRQLQVCHSSQVYAYCSCFV